MGKKGSLKGTQTSGKPALQLVTTGSATSSSFWASLEDLFACDVRALAAFRVSLGLTQLADLGMRMRDLSAHYTDFGVMPRFVQLEKFSGIWEFSFHWISGNSWVMTALFLLQMAITVLFIVGYRARLMTVLSWVLIVSLQNRNPMILHSGDVLFRMLFFWAMFLPVGEKWSVDAALDPEREIRPVKLLTPATVAIFGQIFIEYFFAAMHKQGADWHQEGNAVWYALNVEQFTTTLGLWFRNTFAWALPTITRSVWYFELLGPFFFFCPLYLGQLRLATVLAFVGMHLNFELMLGIGIFPFICISGLMVFLPTMLFDWLETRVLARTEGSLAIWYDGECAFCRKMVLLLREALFLRSVTLAPAQDEPSLAKALREKRSWIVEQDGKRYFRWEALVVVVAHSRVWRWLARPMGWRIVSGIGDRAYRFVANRRELLGRFTAQHLPFRNRRYRLSAAGSVTVTALFAYVLFWNVSTIAPKQFAVPSELKFIAFSMRLDQRWNMFSQPIHEDGWLVVSGHLANDREIDVYNNVPLPVSWERPKLLSAQYPNERWQKYLMNVQMKSNSEHRLHYGRYLCRRHNLFKSGDLRLRDFEIFLMMEKIANEGRKPAEKISLWQHKCY